MPPCIGAASDGRRSAGRICCARRSAWRCCTRASKTISGFWTDCWSCTTMPSVRPRMAGWEKKAASSAWPNWKAGSVICAGPYDVETTPDMKPHEQDFTNLVNELIRLLLAEELFTFVLEPDCLGWSRPTTRWNVCCGTGAGPQGGTDQPDGGRSPSPQRDRERAGIAACEPGEVHLGERAGRSRSLDERRGQLVCPAMANPSGDAGDLARRGPEFELTDRRPLACNGFARVRPFVPSNCRDPHRSSRRPAPSQNRFATMDTYLSYGGLSNRRSL